MFCTTAPADREGGAHDALNDLCSSSGLFVYEQASELVLRWWALTLLSRAPLRPVGTPRAGSTFRGSSFFSLGALG